ncbi:PhnD/SsuA/transferrin family substrate-binding protein, partial [Paraburkholderia sp. BR10879]
MSSSARNAPLMLGAVAYAPKVVTIWEGFKAWFAERGVAIDYLLYSNYETQVEAQFAGGIAFAWNSPLAWIRASRIAQARGETVLPLAMRDTDRDLHSVLVVRRDSRVQTLADLRGGT